MNGEETLALMDGRMDDALAVRDLRADREAQSDALAAENARLRARLLALQVEMASKDAAFAAERAMLQATANIDPLTGLANRRGFDQAALSEVARARGGDVAALLIDIDHFKSVNDTGGHAFGDDVLREFGNVLRDTFRREGDVVGRVGGEEFAAVFAGDGETARQRAEMLRQAIVDAHIFRPDNEPVTASIGAAVLSGFEVKPEALLASADRALYRAKRTGRNRVVLADLNADEGDLDPETAEEYAAESDDLDADAFGATDDIGPTREEVEYEDARVHHPDDLPVEALHHVLDGAAAAHSPLAAVAAASALAPAVAPVVAAVTIAASAPTARSVVRRVTRE